MSIATGILLGVLIGLATSPILVALIRELAALGQGAARLHALIAEALALPGFWLGGPYLTGAWMRGVDLPAAAPFYFGGLVVTLFIFTVPTLYAFTYKGTIITPGRELARPSGRRRRQPRAGESIEENAADMPKA